MASASAWCLPTPNRYPANEAVAPLSRLLLFWQIYLPMLVIAGEDVMGSAMGFQRLQTAQILLHELYRDDVCGGSWKPAGSTAC